MIKHARTCGVIKKYKRINYLREIKVIYNHDSLNIEMEHIYIYVLFFLL